MDPPCVKRYLALKEFKLDEADEKDRKTRSKIFQTLTTVWTRFVKLQTILNVDMKVIPTASEWGPKWKATVQHMGLQDKVEVKCYDDKCVMQYL